MRQTDAVYERGKTLMLLVDLLRCWGHSQSLEFPFAGVNPLPRPDSRSKSRCVLAWQPRIIAQVALSKIARRGSARKRPAASRTQESLFDARNWTTERKARELV